MTDHAERYEPFFGLREPPFSLAPNARFRFASASHSAALSQVAAAIERREPLVVVTGDIGTGKTLLCRTMLQQLPRKTFLSVVDDPMLGRDDLLTQLLQDFGVMSKDRTGPPPARHALVETLHAFLRSLTTIGAHAVVIVDEAQHLQPDVLEQIRLLSNVDDERGTLLQMMLVGQSDLEPLLSRPELRQLTQRVSRRVRLEPLNADEVRQYIEHRLAVARTVPASATPGAADLAQALTEWSGPELSVEFSADAIDAIARISNGLPRVINLLCDRALAAAYHVRLRTIGPPLIATASRSLGLGPTVPEQPVPSVQPLPATPPVAAVGPVQSVQALPPDQPIQPPLPNGDGLSDQPLPPIQPVPPILPVDQLGPVPASLPVDPPESIPPARPRGVRYAGPLAAAVIAAAAIWIGLYFVRRAVPVATPPPATPAQTAAPVPRPAATPPPIKPESPPAATPRAPAASAAEASAPKPAVGAPAAAGTRFDVVVASFRTESRAAAIGASVAALNLPVRRRVADGWQQIVVGPFASRADAESARERLDRAGLTGAQIVPSEP
jgi:type II secretory pathway predicted ATPase ExeA